MEVECVSMLNNQNIIPEDFKFAGLISKSGALISLDNITVDSAIPMQLFHGKKDNLIPYDIGSHHSCEENDVGYLELYGSRAISNHLKHLNKPYYLVTLNNGNHGMQGFSIKDYANEVLTFLNSLKSKAKNEQIEHFY